MYAYRKLESQVARMFQVIVIQNNLYIFLSPRARSVCCIRSVSVEQREDMFSSITVKPSRNRLWFPSSVTVCHCQFFWGRHSVVMKRGSLIPDRQHQQHESLAWLRGKPIASGGYIWQVLQSCFVMIVMLVMTAAQQCVPSPCHVDPQSEGFLVL